jgi:hypothetical protein
VNKIGPIAVMKQREVAKQIAATPEYCRRLLHRHPIGNAVPFPDLQTATVTAL